MNQQKVTKASLSFDQRFKIRDWIKKNAGVLREQQPTFAALAAELTDKFGFRITETIVRTMARHAGVTWQLRHVSRPGAFKPTFADQVLALAVAELYRNLGADMPTALAALVEASSPQSDGKLPAAKGIGGGEVFPCVLEGGECTVGGNGTLRFDGRN